jgi:glycosyltransferase involved in cell wall biosynthesis
LRIHQVISSVLEVHGGPSVSVTTLCRELAALGHEVTLHSHAPGPSSPPPSSYRLRLYSAARVLPQLGLSREMPAGLRAAARAGEIMHVHGLWMLADVWPAWAVRGSDCQLVAAPRGMLEPWALAQRRWRKRAMWLAYQGPAVRAAKLLHVTAESELEAVRALGLRAPAALIPNGVAIPNEDETAHFAAPRRTLLFFSRVHPKKGIEPLIRAWCQTQDAFPDWQLRVVGPGAAPYAASLATLARELRAQRISFVGPAYGAAKTAEFRDAQLFVLPTYSENFGLGVAEALAHGVPAIVGRGAPWSGLSAEGCGYWIDNSVAAIGACLRTALALRPAELQALGARGRAWMMRDFSWRERAKELVEAYGWLHQAGPPPRSLRRQGE